MFAESQRRFIGPNKVIRDAEFAKRLKTLCDSHPDAPNLHYGRLGWLRQQLDVRFDQTVSAETVRRWLAGESIPRREKMSALASLFGVSVAWLSLGHGSSESGDKVEEGLVKAASSDDQLSEGENWLSRLRRNLAGTVTIPEGVDVTAPTGEVWDAEL
ncbi:helix-turn-helix domain-containing protein [Brevundimonas sp.]|uniref:helix-turn-helix domain-containing protein n=1 Tax=Brevundimonas sp. TaxID=1871086 RepID=UPI002ABBC54D|nr:helix-turn-helix domain-containing protein [Brevundimonas sp.]MDZ4363798.1 helix-turn-helix domain-containing protein [Brevundimonas sp.]